MCRFRMLGHTVTNIHPTDPLLCLCGGHWLAPSVEDTVSWQLTSLDTVLEHRRASDSAQLRCIGLLYTSVEGWGAEKESMSLQI